VTQPPQISIVVLCHNYGRFLAEALDSALGQTYANCEVLLMDDGSTDDTLQVAERYRDRVRIFSHPNMGIERTSNRGVGEAHGEYFAFLSADDVFEPTYVEKLYGALQRSGGASFAYCRARKFGAESGVMRCFPFSAFVLARRLNYVNGSALTARADYLEVGGYDETLAEYALEDWDFWLRMVKHGKRGTYVRDPLLRWRRHAHGSRNPQEGARLTRSVDFIRERHAALRRAAGTLGYAIDLAVAAADQMLGFSRFPGVVRALERSSWRRFERRRAAQGV
jgi:glycosyltransferase involved in cell wall biosynthesis